MTTTLVAGVPGALAIVYTMVHHAHDQDSPEPWMLGAGVCLLLIAVVGSLVQGVLISYESRIEALERVAHRNGPSARAPS